MARSPSPHPTILGLAAGAACLAIVAPLVGVGGPAGEVTRTVHADAPAAGAPGRDLALSSVHVPAGAVLARHRHPGTQVATILSGRLHYTVYSGAVEVYRRGPDGAPMLVRTISGGSTGVLTPGTTVVEQPGDIHRAANRGRVPVRISLASLFPAGAAPSIPVPARPSAGPVATPVTAPPRLARPSATGRALSARFFRQLQARDIAGLRLLLSPAFQLQRADGTAFGKAAYLRNLPTVERFRLTRVVGVQVGGTLVVRYRADVTGVIDGASYAPGPAPRLSTFVWNGRRWQLLAHANFNPLERS
jgi:CRP-like cAMP-binding protein